MPQSKVMTNDGDERLDFKSRLNDKVGGLLTVSASTVAESQVLLLPEGHEGMVEAELLFTLTHNPELQHSRDSAAVTVNMLLGRTIKPSNVSFQVVELLDPVPVPEFVAEVPARRKSSGVAPGFTRVKDSAPEREDKEALKKVQFKQSLADGIQKTLVPPAIEKVEKKVLLLPEGHEGMIDGELQFTLTHNPELQHTSESAALAVNILQGRTFKPANVSFRVVELANPVPVPDFLPTARRKTGGESSSVATPRVDSEQERERYLDRQEAEKKVQFKQSLADSIDRKLAETPVPAPPIETRVLLVPSNYEDLTDADLHFTLVNDLELKHSHDSALLTIDVINGRVRPEGTILQIVESVTSFAAQPKRAEKTLTAKPRAKDVAALPHESGGEVMLLPANYQELSEGDLGFVLTHSPDLQHTHEEASFILDVLFGRTKADMDFAVVAPPVVATEPVCKLKSPGEPTVLLLPANYKDFSATDLHSILVNTPELNHTAESASLAVSVVTNNVRPPLGLELGVSSLVVERRLPTTTPTHQGSVDAAWIKVDMALQSTDAEKLVVLPRGFEEMTEQQLVFILVNQVDKGLALDIVDVLKGIRDLPEGIGLTVKE